MIKYKTKKKKSILVGIFKLLIKIEILMVKIILIIIYSNIFFINEKKLFL